MVERGKKQPARSEPASNWKKAEGGASRAHPSSPHAATRAEPRRSHQSSFTKPLAQMGGELFQEKLDVLARHLFGVHAGGVPLGRRSRIVEVQPVEQNVRGSRGGRGEEESFQELAHGGSGEAGTENKSGGPSKRRPRDGVQRPAARPPVSPASSPRPPGWAEIRVGCDGEQQLKGFPNDGRGTLTC